MNSEKPVHNAAVKAKAESSCWILSEIWGCGTQKARDVRPGSKPDKKAIAAPSSAISTPTALARKDLIREHLSKSSIEKLFGVISPNAP